MYKHIYVFFLFLAFSQNALFSEVEDHLKKPAHKFGCQSIRNVDFIYMINLDERPEKFNICVERLSPYGIRPFRFSAVNGWKLSLETINDVGVKYGPWMSNEKMGTYYLDEHAGQPAHETVQIVGRNYFCHCMSRGAIGIVLSHLSVLQDAYDSGYETIWVMEDDIEVIRDPHLLSDLIEKLDLLVGKDHWDVLFTDRDTKNNDGINVISSAYAWRPNFSPRDPRKCELKETVSSDFRRIGARFGAYSMIIRRSGMKKLLDFFKCFQIFLPYDIDFTFPPDIQFYTVLDDVVSTYPRSLSDNGAPNYEKNGSP